MDNEKKIISDSELEKVSGGAGEGGAIEYPILIDTDEKVRSFVAEAQKYSFRISVRDRQNTADARDLAAVMALNRSWTVNCFAECPGTHPFAQFIAGLMDY